MYIDIYIYLTENPEENGVNGALERGGGGGKAKIGFAADLMTAVRQANKTAGGGGGKSNHKTWLPSVRFLTEIGFCGAGSGDGESRGGAKCVSNSLQDRWSLREL